MKKLATVLISILLSITFMQSAFAEMFLFVGDGCPHCVVVEQYLQQNDLINKFQIKILETWYHPENQVIRDQKAKEVGYEGGGVPFLVDGTEYRLGDSPIISYLDGLQNKGPINNGQTNVIGSDATQPPSGTLTNNDSNDLKDALADAVKENSKSLTDKLKDNALYIGVVVIAAGVALFLSLKSKKRK